MALGCDLEVMGFNFGSVGWVLGGGGWLVQFWSVVGGRWCLSFGGRWLLPMVGLLDVVVATKFACERERQRN